MLLNENLFKEIPKRKLTEKKWEHKIDKDLAFRLRDILEDDDTDYEALREVMKDIYDNIHRLIPDMFDEDECESAKEDLDILDTEEEDGFYDPDDEEYDFIDTVEDSWNYELSNLYDICDTFNIWIPIRSLDEDTDYSESEYNEFGTDTRTGTPWNKSNKLVDKLSEKVQAGDVDHYEILDWLSDHEQSYEDAKAYFAPTELYDVSSQDLVDWIMEHELLATDFIDCFKDDLIIESYDKNGNHETCEECGALLTDAGECPKCDLGDEEVSMSEQLHLNGGNDHIDSVGQLVYNEVKKIDPNVEVLTGNHTKVGVFTKNSNQVEQLKEAAIKAMAEHGYKPEAIKFKQFDHYSGYVFDQISTSAMEYEPLRMKEAFVTKDMPGLIKAAKAAGLTTLSELDAFIKEHEGEDIMKALSQVKNESVVYPNGEKVTDIDLDKALDYQYGTDRDQDNSKYTDEEKQKAVDYWMKKTDPSPYNENLITNTLPPIIDQFLMDMAQTTNAFDYNDVSKFAKRATEEDIKKLKNLRRKWLRDAEMMEDDELEAFGQKVASIVK